MRKYFRQFGSIQRLRLSRNKKTGASKHYAFIEFANNDVADIVAKTMQNYLMFGHILQCKKIPAEQVHPELFKGASERFKVDPRNKKAGKAMVNGTVRAKWAKRVAKENDKRIKEAKELKEEFGYEFIPPTLMDVDDVPKQVDTAAGAEQQLQLETPVADVTQVVESTPDHLTVTETVKVKKSNDAKGKAEAELETDGALGTAQAALDAAPAVPAPKAKKNRKRKSDATVEVIEAAPVDVPAPKAKKARKAKA
jgi:nucleolar protein 15